MRLRAQRRMSDPRSSRRIAFDALRSLAAGKPVFTAGLYAPDGVTGKTGGFIDWNDATHQLVQATSANQCAFPAGEAAFGGVPTAAFLGSQRYTSNRAASAWRYLHDGTGCTVYNVLFPTHALTDSVQVILCTASDYRAGTGTMIGFGATGGAAYIARFGSWSASTSVFGVDTTSGAFYTGHAYIQSYSYVEGGSPEFRLGYPSGPEYGLPLVTASGSTAIAPAAGDPSSTLVLGATPAGGSGAKMRWAATFTFPFAASAAQRSQIESLLVQAFPGAAAA